MLTSSLSSRAQHLLQEQLYNEDIDDATNKLRECVYQRFLSDSYSVNNPNGIIQLAYAENRLLWDIVGRKLRDSRDVIESVTYYDFAYGSKSLRNEFAKLCSRTTLVSMNPDNLIMTSGCEAALDLLLHCIADPADGVIVFLPSYHGFFNAIEHRNRLQVIGVDLGIDECMVPLDDLERLINDAITNANCCIKAIVMSNPHCPLGTMWTHQQLGVLLTICKQHEIHLVCDEILSFTVFSDFNDHNSKDSEQSGCDDSRKKEFTSIFSLDGVDIDFPSFNSYVHVVSGLSKLGLGGFKIGALYSQCPNVLKTCRQLSRFTSISTHTQLVVSRMLADTNFVDEWLSTCSKRLKCAYQSCIEALSDNNLSYVKTDSGLTIFLDFRAALNDIIISQKASKVSTDTSRTQSPTSRVYAEKILFENLFAAGVFLIPGSQFRMCESGWFRLVFSAPIDEVNIAINRIGQFMKKNHPKVLVSGAKMRLKKMWSRTDTIFNLLRDSDGNLENGLMQRPIEFRHPFLFYVGHLAAFCLSQLKLAFRNSVKIPSHEFDTLFERGIDPDISSRESHQKSYEEGFTDWPSVDKILLYRDGIRETLVNYLPAIFSLNEDDELLRNGRLLELIIEHELMHQETLLYMMCQVPVAKLKANSSFISNVNDGGLEEFHPLAEKNFITVPNGRVLLGTERNEMSKFGWDNEFPSQEIDVNSFEVSELPVTNGEFLVFVEHYGYKTSEYWSDESWEWLRRENISHPSLWSFDEGSNEWKYRTLLTIVPLHQVLRWPVFCSQAEASAYCKFRSCRLLSEPEWQLVAYGPTLEDEDSQCSKPLKRYSWGIESPHYRQANVDFRHWTPQPCGVSNTSNLYGVQDLIGSGWEWTSTVFSGFPGFKHFPQYAGYSEDFFDGKHFVMKGASWATARELIRPTFRNWFQAVYPYTFSKFRCARNIDSINSLSNDRVSLKTLRYSKQAPSSSSSSSLSSSSSCFRTCSGSFIQPESSHQKQKLHDQFRLDVLCGLTMSPKKMKPIYFYDDFGSELYARITETEDYYPTKTEYCILERQTTAIVFILRQLNRPYNVVELGAGDSCKVVHLLRELMNFELCCQYFPIDISPVAVQSLEKKLSSDFKDKLNITSVVADNIEGLRWVSEQSRQHRLPILLLFLGSSIGNYESHGDAHFLKQIWTSLSENDMILIGFDLLKSPSILLPAYNDAEGVTTQFNFNLLERMNRELGANFNTSLFEHFATFNPELRRMESWMLSKVEQNVTIKSLERSFHFKKWEPIHFENSHKYTLESIEAIAIEAGFEVVQNFMDEKEWFADSLWRVRKL